VQARLLKPTLRPARRADAAACSALVLRLVPELAVRPRLPGLERFLASVSTQRQQLAIRQHRYWVAEADGEIVGLAGLRTPRHLFHLFVAPQWQGRGLGLRLFRAVTEGADEHLPLTVNSSWAAVSYYSRLGFRPTAALQWADGIAYLPMRRA